MNGGENMATCIQFDDGFLFSEEKVINIAEKILKKIYDELPSEARRYDVIKYVLSECMNKTETLYINL